MCGIAGILRVHAPGAEVPPPWVAIPEAWLDVLDDSIKHRGPDGFGRFRDRVVRADRAVVDVALVHRRLSIIDHAGGHQPMVLYGADRAGDRDTIPSGVDPGPYRRTADRALRPCPRCAALGRGTVAVVFNGCIYNHRELRKGLQAAGHTFSTDHSDTEVLVHGWAEWESGVFSHLNAMGALAAWDSVRASLVCYRTVPGEKPLYSAASRTPESLAFSSAPAGLWRLSDPLRFESLDDKKEAAAWWLALGYHAAMTPFGSVAQPGFGYLVADNQTQVALSKNAAPLERASAFLRRDLASSFRIVSRPSRPRGDLVQLFDGLLRQAVESHLEADVPVGCFVSGGVDSSLIAQYARAAAGHLRTICVRMPDPHYDESRFAEAVAARIGSDHRTIDVAADPARDLILLITSLGLPFGDSSLLPTYWASRAAAGEVKVVLSGDGGDELFYGYERYRAMPPGARAAGLLSWLVPTGLLNRCDPKSNSDKLARLLTAWRHWSYESLLAIFPEPDLRSLVGWRRASGILAGSVAGGAANARGCELYSHLQGDMLRKVDAASMLAGVEVRAPFLDRSLLEQAWNLSPRQAMPRSERKGLLRAVARKYFSAEIVDRPKMGFAIPIGEWFRSDYGGMRQLLRDHLEGPEPFGAEALGIGSMINMEFVRRMLREHDDAGAGSIWPWKGRDHSQRLYMMLVLSIWAKWLGGVA